MSCGNAGLSSTVTISMTSIIANDFIFYLKIYADEQIAFPSDNNAELRVVAKSIYPNVGLT